MDTGLRAQGLCRDTDDAEVWSALFVAKRRKKNRNTPATTGLLRALGSLVQSVDGGSWDSMLTGSREVRISNSYGMVIE